MSLFSFPQLTPTSFPYPWLTPPSRQTSLSLAAPATIADATALHPLDPTMHLVHSHGSALLTCLKITIQEDSDTTLLLPALFPQTMTCHGKVSFHGSLSLLGGKITAI